MMVENRQASIKKRILKKEIITTTKMIEIMIKALVEVSMKKIETMTTNVKIKKSPQLMTMLWVL